MDKRLIFSVAGSGKTSYIVDKLKNDSRALVITYTENNYFNLRKRIVKKFGQLPQGIKIFKYFSFLYSFCYRPFIHKQVKSKGFYWNQPPQFTMRLKRDDLRFYLLKDKRLYHNRVAKLLEKLDLYSSLQKRISKYFDCLFIDEVQDFAGHDFNLLMSMTKSDVDVALVGDFFQHTFDTSRDGNVNSTLHKNCEKYLSKIKSNGILIDTTTLSHSFRCRKNICDFISKNLGISIESQHEDDAEVKHIVDKDEILKIFMDDSIIKLFYQSHNKYNCYSQNWGSSKGIDHYENVCVILNETTYKLFEKQNLKNLNPKTKNKLYVACSRARHNLYFIREKMLKDVLK